jgi:hypothetical protein
MRLKPREPPWRQRLLLQELPALFLLGERSLLGVRASSLAWRPVHHCDLHFVDNFTVGAQFLLGFMHENGQRGVRIRHTG